MSNLKTFVRKIPVINNIARSVLVYYKTFAGIIRLKRAVNKTTPLNIVIGAAGVIEDGWIPTDIEYLNLLNTDHCDKYFKKNSIEAILAEHVWEHFSQQDGLIAARNCYDYLKSGGYVRAAVPDGLHPDKDYIR